METILLIDIHIGQDLKFILDIIDYLIVGLSIAIMLDDRDTLEAMERIKKKKIENKVKERNEMFEAIITTKGHNNLKIWKRYLVITVITGSIFFVEEIYNTNMITLIVSIIALVFTIKVKNNANKNFERLRRVKKD